MTRLILPPATVEEMNTVQGSVAEMRRYVDSLPSSDAAEDCLYQALSYTRSGIKGLEAQRTEITRPMLAAKRQVDAMFAPASDALADLERRIRERLAEMAVSRAERDESALRAAKAALEAGDLSGVALSTASISGTQRAKISWEVASVDMTLLPSEYQIVTADIAAITRAIYAHTGGGPPTIPGVTFARSAKIRAR